MKKVVIALEGLAGAGKTTLGDALKAQGFRLLPEISDTVPETNEIKRFTSNDQSSLNTNQWFLNVEAGRMQAVSQSAGPIVMDRCFISQIAYNYAKDKIHGSDHTAQLRETMAGGNWQVPNIVYLQMDAQLSLDRMIARDKDEQRQLIFNGEPDYSLDFVEQNRLYYEKIIPFFKHGALVLDAREKSGQHIQHIKKWYRDRDTFIKDFDINLLFN